MKRRYKELKTILRNKDYFKIFFLIIVILDFIIIFAKHKTQNNMKQLTKIQAELKCPKGSFNKFGGFKYRSAEQILESAKPILYKYESVLILSDEIVEVGSKLFLKATATLINTDGEIKVNAYAELSEHKGMSSEQTTGTASSYARKYALNGLFLIDETENDPDSKDNRKAETLDNKRFLEALKAIQENKFTAEELRAKFDLTPEQLKAL